ncbi:helix-turn-helix transcriptional regulator [Amycolatopsis sp. NPDC051128]|uniref:helix-turn-helix domain-containing protein n=1 Tax=Amycolatopsis sp. NPDC051128 TaxID=3155412 RepID=UPI003447741D
MALFLADDPVVARIQLGLLLRELRQDAERTAAQACKHLNCSPAKMSMVENGKQGIPVREVAALLDFYGADDTSAAEALRLAAIPWPKRRGRRALYQEAVPATARRYVALEAEAREIVAFDNAVINGLLQTREYARTLLAAGAPYPGSHEIDVKLDIRMRRQDKLFREEPSPLELDVIIDEACLRRRIGSAGIMRAQLEHLIQVSERENVRLQVLPFVPKNDEAFNPQTAFSILKLPERGSLVYIEDFAGGIYPEDGLLIQEYATAFERLRRAALDGDEARAFLARLVAQDG